MRDDLISAIEVEFGPLSARERQMVEHGVQGGDESTDPPADPPVDPAAPADPAATPTDPPADPAPEGDPPAAADPAPEASIDVPELAVDLTGVDDAALRAQFDQYGALITEHRATATPAQLPALEQALAGQRSIVAELERRAAEAADATARIEALNTDAPVLPDPVAVPALASAAAVVAGRDPQATIEQAPPEVRPERPRAALVAAAGANVASPGTVIELPTLGEAIDSVKSGDAGKSRLASLQGFEEIGADQFPEALSRSNTWETNNELIRQAQSDFMAVRAGERPAHTATICEPLDILRDLPDAFNATEVVSPELPSRPSGRLGFQHSLSIDLGAVLDGVALWDETDQAAVDPTDPDTWKPCVDVECPEPINVKAEAVVACLKFDITTEMSNPETVRNYMNALDALRARTKEGRILQRLDAL